MSASSAYRNTIGPLAEHVLTGGTRLLDAPLDPATIGKIASPFTRGYLRQPLASLALGVRRQWFDLAQNEPRSGIDYPKLIHIETPNAGDFDVREVHLLGVRVTDTGVDSFVLGGEPEEPKGVRIGNVPLISQSGVEFTNMGPGLGYETSYVLTRMALAGFMHRATFNEYND